MAYMEPSEEQISTVISITNLDPLGDRDLVMLALQVRWAMDARETELMRKVDSITD